MDSFLAFFTEPFAFAFMQRALVMSILIAVVCAIFSCFLVLKGWSLIGDAVAHAILPGLGGAFILGIPLAVGAFVSGFFCALTTGFIQENSRIKHDTVIGIVFSGMFAIGLVMVTKLETDIHLMHILTGNILGITTPDLLEAGIIAVVCSLVMLIKRKDYMLYCFDESHTTSIGLPVRVLRFSLLILLTLTIVSAIKAAGIILVVAMLIAPGAIGFLLCRSFDRMLIAAIIVSVIACCAGTLLSFHWDVATAPLIVVIQAVFFLLALGRKTLSEIWQTATNVQPELNPVPPAKAH